MRIGSLFSGYGGLDQAVAAYTGGHTVWVSDIGKGANKVLAYRYPDAPNLGDISTVDWSAVEPVDILTGGFPCQDVSHAGKRAGVRPGTRSGLWTQMAYAVDQLKPKLVVIENVRGLLSASAHSDMEPCTWCVGEGTDRGLRALGAVLGDLADIGYDARWCGLRAADIGAPHGRFRIFIVAYPRDLGLQWSGGPWTGGARLENDGGEPVGLLPTPRATRGGSSTETAVLLQSPRATDGTKGGPNQRGSSGDLMLPSAVRLLPTPAVNDMGAGKTVDAWDAWTDDMRTKHGNGNGHGKSLSIEAQRLLPTPTRRDHKDPEIRREPHRPESVDTLSRALTDFGAYAPAIERWERLTRPVPEPTRIGKKGQPKLSQYFDEWMMGLPAGWVTDVPGVSWNEALKLCGNGVVPAQALEALRRLLG